MRVLEESNLFHLRNSSTYVQVIVLLHASLASNQPSELIPPAQLFADFALRDYLRRAAAPHAFSPICELVITWTIADE